MNKIYKNEIELKQVLFLNKFSVWKPQLSLDKLTWKNSI